ncbi:unnamed protein product [Rhizoctonia solani]|uniref:Protein kinase domain-containing protein n=1 Tax=Rhizoctonia solani TaxID=456999 RepID=A0A8H3BY86_9AGAM|nr:unnamed protein product [Rhizoctonia solani]
MSWIAFYSTQVLPAQPISEILIRLGRHGCQDITSQLSSSRFGSSAVSTGGFGDVYQGILQDGTLVGIKCLRILVGMDDESGRNQLKRAARELYVWSKCKHPNILDLLGVAKYDNRVAMVSPWMMNGNLTWYLTRYPSADRYNLCTQIADAIAFLKENGIVHGDIKGANILVSDDHIPKLTDFGNSAISECTLRFTSTTGSLQTTLRWTAPEIFLGETKHTFEGDVYALGMTILEAFTGSAPYNGLLDVTVMRNLMQKIHPARPEKHFPIGNTSTDLLWALMVRCWDIDISKRPFALDIKAIVLARSNAYSPNHSGSSGETHTISSVNTVSIDMSPRHVLQCLVAQGCHDMTQQVEGTLSVWRREKDESFDRGYDTKEGTTGLLDGTEIMLRYTTKSRRYYYRGASETILPTLDKHTAYEAYILSQCNHLNIQGIMGVALHGDTFVICSLNPTEYQPLRHVLSSNAREFSRCKVSTQISDAVVYLHRKKITHGDINKDNIHLSPDYVPQLGGFHNAFAHSPSLIFPSREKSGSTEYSVFTMTYEQSYSTSIRESAFEVDIFALGGAILDVTTWGQFSSYGALNWRPEDFIPTDSDDGNRLWSLLQECLAHRSEVRPWATDVQRIMATITDQGLQKRSPKSQPS